MKRFFLSLGTGFLITLIATVCAADLKLEVGVDAGTSFVNDPSYEAFSSSNLTMNRFGGQIRLALDSPWKHVQIVPLVGYMGSADNGEPYEIIETEFALHDFFAGVRFRGWLLSWFGVFAQVNGGLAWARMSGELNGYYGDGTPVNYEDDDVTWSAGGFVGLEFRIPPKTLASRGVNRFNFGGEIGMGYLRRGDVAFAPKAEGGDEYTLPVEQSGDWGELNLSGFVFQMGVTVSFL